LQAMALACWQATAILIPIRAFVVSSKQAIIFQNFTVYHFKHIRSSPFKNCITTP
jgi:hypothetical protein